MTSTERKNLLKGENQKIMAGLGHPPAERQLEIGRGLKESDAYAVTFFIHGHLWWQEGMVGISQQCYCWLLPGLSAGNDVWQPRMAGTGSSWILTLFFKQVELEPVKISPENLNLLLGA